MSITERPWGAENAKPLPTTGPDPSLKPTYGSATLKAGHRHHPLVTKLTAGGSIKTRLGGVNAYVAKAPTFHLNYKAGQYPLTFRVAAQADTTLLIKLPDGTWIANDDGGAGRNPLIHLPNPRSGRYHVYVGTYGPNPAPARLYIADRQ